jgi:hypothetical protein
VVAALIGSGGPDLVQGYAHGNHGNLIRDNLRAHLTPNLGSCEIDISTLDIRADQLYAQLVSHIHSLLPVC